jgi:hypothetical protein
MARLADDDAIVQLGRPAELHVADVVRLRPLPEAVVAAPGIAGGGDAGAAAGAAE